MRSFAEIANECGTDKQSGCGYGPHYEAHVFPYVPRDTRSVILELGVSGGGSLRMWEELYPYCTKITGVDIDPKCLTCASDRSRVLIGDQSDQDFLRRAADPPPDLVVDDGSHELRDVITSFAALWSIVKSIYVIEDIWDEFLPIVERRVRITDAHVTVCPSSSPRRFILFARKL